MPKELVLVHRIIFCPIFLPATKLKALQEQPRALVYPCLFSWHLESTSPTPSQHPLKSLPLLPKYYLTGMNRYPKTRVMFLIIVSQSL